MYRAVHLQTGRVAALKILHASSSAPSFVERFRNEARILSALQHPNIAGWYETLEVDGHPCIAMEYVTGDTLEQRLQRGALPAREALALFAALCDAVAYIHARGIVHRDLKANNVKIDDAGTVKLLDFGIARAGDSPRLTTDGSVVGTLHYLSPEQIRGETASPASDVWALGVLLYEMVTGRVPFTGDSFTAVMARILKGSYEAPSVVTAGLPRECERLIARCLRVDAGGRYANGGALAAEVRDALGPARPAASGGRGRWRLATSVAAALVAAYALLWTLRARQEDCCAPPPRREPVRDTAPVPVAGGRPVVIRVFEGTAEVVRDGRVVGRTPLTLSAPVGAWLDLTLRQPGFDDLRQRLQVSDGPNEYHYTMQRAR